MEVAPTGNADSLHAPKESKEGAHPRHVFISASFLHRQFRSVPPNIMKDAIFFFGSKRSWGKKKHLFNLAPFALYKISFLPPPQPILRWELPNHLPHELNVLHR